MNEEKLSLPKGLTEVTLTEVLKKKFGDVCIKGIQATSGSKAGDNNLSEVSRITVNFTVKNKERSKSLIIKDTKKADSIFVNIVSGIEKEISWYENILPEIDKLGTNIGAACHMIHEECLLLEDLSVEGYKVVDRMAMLDLDHCLKAVEALARFHAVTHYLYESNKLPEIAVKETLLTPPNKKDVYENFRNFDKIIESLKELGETRYNDTIKTLQTVAYDKMLQCIHDNQEFLCLVHGDYWTTNILFKYNSENKVSDAKIIDFQLIRLMIPAFDLHLFICTSVRREVREHHLDQMFKVYLETLNSTLKSVSSKTTLSQEQFDKMMKGTNFMGIFIALTFLPVPLCESPLQFKPQEDLSEEEKKNYNAFNVVYKQNTYRKHLLGLLDFYKINSII